MTGPAPEREPLGMVVDGSLTRGVEVRLAPAASVEDVKVGAFVTIQGERQRFFGVVTDICVGFGQPQPQIFAA